MNSRDINYLEPIEHELPAVPDGLGRVAQDPDFGFVVLVFARYEFTRYHAQGDDFYDPNESEHTEYGLLCGVYGWTPHGLASVRSWISGLQTGTLANPLDPANSVRFIDMGRITPGDSSDLWDWRRVRPDADTSDLVALAKRPANFIGDWPWN